MAVEKNPRAARLQKAGFPVDALSEKLQAQIGHLDDQEIAALESIKRKLNSGLDAKLKEAADVVGGFVW
jgi:hypothetical protein